MRTRMQRYHQRTAREQRRGGLWSPLANAAFRAIVLGIYGVANFGTVPAALAVYFATSLASSDTAELFRRASG